ncbi:hypothetical protein ACP275_14G143800 [Erythranthe tilingii]
MELAAKVEQSYVVGPTEDVVQALLETLVDPLLPSRFSNIPPSETIQNSVAKQMHAVVLLYNYHHRKQNPGLPFLDLLNFCKLAVVIRPPLIAFMKSIIKIEPTESNTAEENELSITEKAVQDACEIAACLDASRDFPNVKEWPIYEIAIVLIDSGNENCMLLEASINQEMLRVKRKQNASSSSDSEYLQIAYDSVKETTGIDSSELEVLKKHVTYSSSEKKAAACFYMMRCAGSYVIDEPVSIKVLVQRLQGPVAIKAAFGLWKTTPVAKVHHMLPYISFISSWLSGGSRNLVNRENDNKQPSIINVDVIVNLNGTHNNGRFVKKEAIKIELDEFGEDTRNNNSSAPNEDGTNVSRDVGDDVTIPYNENRISENEEELQNALALLHRKRQAQYARICSMEETLALYEDKIARIRDGGDIGLSREFIKSIASGNRNPTLEHETQKLDKEKIRLPKNYFPGKSPCQDLEYTCLMNNWRLPRYLIETSSLGKFVSYVAVEGKEFKLHSKGGIESKPCEARESAARQMLAKLQNSCV